MLVLTVISSPNELLASNTPVINVGLSQPATFATRSELENFGFVWGPSDGAFGAIPAGSGNYRFYGSAAGGPTCSGAPNAKGAFLFTGTLNQVTGNNGCTRFFGPGDGPSGWLFDENYSGGGQVLQFSYDGQTGWLMPFHAEEWWQNPMASNHKCDNVPCFYSSLGLAVSTDGGNTFKVVGEILQPSEPLSAFEGGGRNMAVGTGSLVVADANGNHLTVPPTNPGGAYFYLFYTDLAPGLQGACEDNPCMGVARAPYQAVVQAALSGNATKVATLFRKYNGAVPDSWTQPATSDTPGQTGIAGVYAPLWTDDWVSQPSVIYDSSFNGYLVAYQSRDGVRVRASYNLINWSEPIGSGVAETGYTLYAPTLLGETADPTIAGAAPRLYFTTFPSNSFPNWETSTFETVQLTVSENSNASSSLTTTSYPMLLNCPTCFQAVSSLSKKESSSFMQKEKVGLLQKEEARFN